MAPPRRLAFSLKLREHLLQGQQKARIVCHVPAHVALGGGRVGEDQHARAHGRQKRDDGCLATADSTFFTFFVQHNDYLNRRG